MAIENKKKLAVVTGASSGIGFELARQCVEHGFDVIACSEHPDITSAAADLARGETIVIPVQADLATFDGVESLFREISAMRRPIDVLMLNAGVGVGGEFLNTSLEDELKMIALNCMHTVHLAKRVLPEMIRRNEGRILITGSVVSTSPSPFEAVYAATKAFVMSFGEGLRGELKDRKDCKVTVTVLQPGATDTEFFTRANMLGTPVGQAKKDDPALVARNGFEAMMAGKDSVLGGGFKAKVEGLLNEVLPETVKANQAAKHAKPPTQKH